MLVCFMCLNEILMKMLSYKRISAVGYSLNAEKLQSRFGGKGVPFTREVAEYCANEDWCLDGAIDCIFPKRLQSIVSNCFYRWAMKHCDASVVSADFVQMPTVMDQWLWLLRYVKRFQKAAAKRREAKRAA